MFHPGSCSALRLLCPDSTPYAVQPVISRKGLDLGRPVCLHAAAAFGIDFTYHTAPLAPGAQAGLARSHPIGHPPVPLQFCISQQLR